MNGSMRGRAARSGAMSCSDLERRAARQRPEAAEQAESSYSTTSTLVGVHTHIHTSCFTSLGTHTTNIIQYIHHVHTFHIIQESVVMKIHTRLVRARNILSYIIYNIIILILEYYYLLFTS